MVTAALIILRRTLGFRLMLRWRKLFDTFRSLLKALQLSIPLLLLLLFCLLLYATGGVRIFGQVSGRPRYKV